MSYNFIIKIFDEIKNNYPNLSNKVIPEKYIIYVSQQILSSLKKEDIQKSILELLKDNGYIIKNNSINFEIIVKKTLSGDSFVLLTQDEQTNRYELCYKKIQHSKIVYERKIPIFGDSNRFLIGRAENGLNDIVNIDSLKLSKDETFISREHLEVHFNGKKVNLIVLSKSQPVFINNNELHIGSNFDDILNTSFFIKNNQDYYYEFVIEEK